VLAPETGFRSGHASFGSSFVLLHWLSQLIDKDIVAGFDGGAFSFSAAGLLFRLADRLLILGASGGARMFEPCDCGSGASYVACCGRLHAGAPARDAEELIRKTPGLFMARRIGPQRLSQNVYSRGRDMIYKLIDPEQSADYAKFRDNVANTLERHLSAYGPDKPKFALDEVCKCLFIASCGNELLYRALHREFVVTHPQTEAWLSLLKTDEQASMFVSTAMSIVAETD
jgi:hypothetical protein